MKKLLTLLVVAGSITATQAQDLLKEFNSRSFQLGSCMLILNQDKQISNKNINSWIAVAQEMKNDQKAINIYNQFGLGLNSRNAQSMFRMSQESCAKLGYKVL